MAESAPGGQQIATEVGRHPEGEQVPAEGVAGPVDPDAGEDAEHRSDPHGRQEGLTGGPGDEEIDGDQAEPDPQRISHAYAFTRITPMLFGAGIGSLPTVVECR